MLWGQGYCVPSMLCALDWAELPRPAELEGSGRAQVGASVHLGLSGLTFVRYRLWAVDM